MSLTHPSHSSPRKGAPRKGGSQNLLSISNSVRDQQDRLLSESARKDPPAWIIALIALLALTMIAVSWKNQQREPYQTYVEAEAGWR